MKDGILGIGEDYEANVNNVNNGGFKPELQIFVDHITEPANLPFRI